MFTWICPQCGREVPPSYSECPTCAERKKGGITAAAAPPTPPPPPAPPAVAHQAPPPFPPQATYAPPPPPAYAAPPQQALPQPQYTIAEAKSGLPGWLIAVLAAAVLGGALYLAYTYLLPGHRGSASAPGVAAEKAVPAGAATAHPYGKFIEVAALRLSEEKGKPKLMYAVVNHSSGELAGVELRISLRPTTAKPEDAAIATFTAKVGSIGPYEAKEMSTPIETKERAYELPDWQFLRADFEITSPK